MRGDATLAERVNDRAVLVLAARAFHSDPVRVLAMVVDPEDRGCLDLFAVVRADHVADRGFVRERGELTDHEHHDRKRGCGNGPATHERDVATDTSELHLRSDGVNGGTADATSLQVQQPSTKVTPMSSRANLDELRQAIRARGLRATSSRIAVLGALGAIEQPLSHAEVATRLAHHGWDPATLYRNLMDFAEAGLVRRSDLGDHVWRFELTRGGHDASGHPHFVCTACSTTQCLPVIELVLPRGKTPRSVRQRRVEVHLRGLCDTCG